MSQFCELAGICSGCPWMGMPYSHQMTRKRDELKARWLAVGLPRAAVENLTLESLGEGGLRDRVDMTLHREGRRVHLGLYDVDRQAIVDIQSCPQMSPVAAAWFAEFRTMLPDIQFGHLRLRIAPDGRRGIWLDFPNHRIQELLQRQLWLRRLAERAVVELGQRRQRLVVGSEGLELGPAQPAPWFETYLGESQQPQALYCSVGDFTQPGFAANRALVALVRQAVLATDARNWLEIGAGIGNFTLPLAAEGLRVHAVDQDPRALSGLERAMAETALGERITTSIVNVGAAGSDPGELLKGCTGILVDPPRAGLGRFLQSINPGDAQLPQWFVYVSCHGASLIADLAILRDVGYKPLQIRGLDQFPQSRHCEWIVLLQKS